MSVEAMFAAPVHLQIAVGQIWSWAAVSIGRNFDSPISETALGCVSSVTGYGCIEAFIEVAAWAISMTS